MLVLATNYDEYSRGLDRDQPDMSEPLPIRLSDGGRVATWNPAMTRASHVVVRVVSGSGSRADRRSMNSGRARVREGEAIEAVLPLDQEPTPSTR